MLKLLLNQTLQHCEGFAVVIDVKIVFLLFWRGRRRCFFFFFFFWRVRSKGQYLSSLDIMVNMKLLPAAGKIFLA